MRFVTTCLLTWALCGQAAPWRRVLVGGGELPSAALATFVRWAGGPHARIAVAPWGSGDPDGTFAWVKSELEGAGAGHVFRVDPPTSAASLHTWGTPTGFFLPGGDQNRFLAAAAPALEAFRQLLRNGMSRGAPVMGTSAGTAVLAQSMFTGRLNPNSPWVRDGELVGVDPLAVVLAPGLGLLSGVLVDQHFFRRRRELRLFSAFLKAPEPLALGIDEDTAVVWEGGTGCVTGAGYVLSLRKVGGGQTQRLLPPGYCGPLWL